MQQVSGSEKRNIPRLTIHARMELKWDSLCLSDAFGTVCLFRTAKEWHAVMLTLDEMRTERKLQSQGRRKITFEKFGNQGDFFERTSIARSVLLVWW